MKYVLAGVLSAIIIACGSGKKTDEQAFLNSLDSAKTDTSNIDDELISGVLQGIPSPIEISVLLKHSGRKYDQTMLNSPDNLPKYNNNYKMALNLGIYGTDLGYTNIYEQNQDGIKYLQPIEQLAEGLNIGQFFEIETIGRLAANSKNLDSLLLLTTKNFNDINLYLSTQSRANLSVLLLTGGWLEAMHITCQLSSKDPSNKVLQDTIGEQQIILEQIILLLKFYPADESMASLLKDMENLQSAFEKIKITTTYKAPTSEVVNGVVVVKDNSTTTVDITPEDVINIKNITSEIRNKIIG
ncbi:MAG TPA: hypothetical protein VK508_20440 [Cyclobacteriaceae bacterium]|nr:hypothetical protein [Cyclobacteriaceae bacterium]